MTEAERELIEAALAYARGDAEHGTAHIVRWADEVSAERVRHPYGTIAESMLVEPRKPEPYGYDPVTKGVSPLAVLNPQVVWIVGQNRDVCDPAPRTAEQEAEHWKRRLRMGPTPQEMVQEHARQFVEASKEPTDGLQLSP